MQAQGLKRQRRMAGMGHSNGPAEGDALPPPQQYLYTLGRKASLPLGAH